MPEDLFQISSPMSTSKLELHLKEQNEQETSNTNGNKADTPSPPPHDAKWRYFWNIGDMMEDIAQNRLPNDFPEW